MAKFTPKKKQQLRRVRRFIKAAEKRGFQFASDIKEKLSSYTTQKLKSLTPEKLYKQAEYKLGEELIISGEEGRKLEKTIASKKAVRTRRIKKYGYEEYLLRYEPSSYESYRRGYEEEYTRYEQERESQQEEYIPSFTDIILSNIEGLIKQANSSKWDVAVANSYTLGGALQEEIATYGRDKVAQACEDVGEDLISLVNDALFKASSTTMCYDMTMSIMQIIKAQIPTIDESKQISDIVDANDENYMQNEI